MYPKKESVRKFHHSSSKKKKPRAFLLVAVVALVVLERMLPSKRAKGEDALVDEVDPDDEDVGYVAHPLGIVPSVVSLMTEGGGRRSNCGVADGQQVIPRASLGQLAVLKDWEILDVLSQLDAVSLAQFSRCSKLCFVFASTDELWKQLVLQEARQCAYARAHWRFSSSWKRTFANLAQSQQQQRHHSSASGGTSKKFPSRTDTHTGGTPTHAGTCTNMAPARTANVGHDDGADHNSQPALPFSGVVPSDTLFEAWLAATARVLPHWLLHNNIERRKSSDLTAAMFDKLYEQTRTPVVIEGAAREWPALKRWHPDTIADELCSADGQPQLFDAFDEYSGSHRMTMAQYLAYARQQRDERPLYVFEPRYIEENPRLSTVYATPPQFQHDLMALLGKERPDWRWLLAGPARTGTNFHVDPNHTSAWNTVIYGRKKWIMFPPDVVPPGVLPQPEAGRVEQPDSVMTWFLEHYDEIREDPEYRASVCECVCGPGDTVFIPDGWWHLVLNLEETVAVTHNYVGPANLKRCLRFLDTRSPFYMNLAGGSDLHAAFRRALKQHRPELLRDVDDCGDENGGGGGGGGVSDENGDGGTGQVGSAGTRGKVTTFSFNFAA